MKLNWRKLSIARLALILAPAIVIASLAACSDDSESLPSPTAPSTTTSTETPAPTSPTRTPSQSTPIPAYSPETRTGIAAIDPILVSVLAADTKDVESRPAYVDVPCASSKAIPGPECPPGSVAGTFVPAFPTTSCESTYDRKDAIGPVVEGFVTTGLTLFAIYRVDASKAGDVAPGHFELVFVDPRPTPGDAGAIMVVVTADNDGRIVRWGNSCGATDPHEFLDERPVSTYVLPPR